MLKSAIISVTILDGNISILMLTTPKKITLRVPNENHSRNASKSGYGFVTINK